MLAGGGGGSSPCHAPGSHPRQGTPQVWAQGSGPRCRTDSPQPQPQGVPGSGAAQPPHRLRGALSWGGAGRGRGAKGSRKRAGVRTRGGAAGSHATWRGHPGRPRPGQRPPCPSPDRPVPRLGRQPRLPAGRARDSSGKRGLGLHGVRGLGAARLAATETPLGGRRPGSKAAGWRGACPSNCHSPRNPARGQRQSPQGSSPGLRSEAVGARGTLRAGASRPEAMGAGEGLAISRVRARPQELRVRAGLGLSPRSGGQVPTKESWQPRGPPHSRLGHTWEAGARVLGFPGSWLSPPGKALPSHPLPTPRTARGAQGGP